MHLPQSTWELYNPRLPVRQWVLSVPKRLRYFMQRDWEALNMVLRIYLRVIAQNLQSNCPGSANVDKTALHIGAVAFVHRFGSSLNEHAHFHVCVVDGVSEQVVGDHQTSRKQVLVAVGLRCSPVSFQSASTGCACQAQQKKYITNRHVAHVI
jgi:hypothetical protein